MPRLIDLSRITNEAHNVAEYFKDVYWNSQGQRYDFEITHTYPHELYVHGPTQKDDDPSFLLDLRRFVERSAAGDVVYRYKNMGYKWCWNMKDAKYDWDRSYSDISHGYWILNFEEETDLVMFKLRKPNLVTDTMCEFHPQCDYHDDENTRKW
jgi:hypothetical protein